jgi:hypothetical protein
MLLTEINGASATAHPLARLFIEEGFSPSALGLQARIAGTRIAGMRGGGTAMAEQRRNNNDPIETPDPQQQRDESLQEGESVRGERNEGSDVDPDSADSDVDRDDTVTK